MKKILSIIMLTMALPATALEKDKVEHKNIRDIVQSHSFTNINTSRTLYFVIKTTGIATKPVSGTEKVSSYLIGVV